MKTIVGACAGLAISVGGAYGEAVYEGDVEVALERIEKECGRFFEPKKIDWTAVSKQFTEEAKAVSSDQEHLVLLVRLLARLEDGHAAVRPLGKGKNVKWPERPAETGMGMFWCRVEDRIYVKNAWGGAKAAGAAPGMEVVKVEREPVADWIAARTEELADLISFSTPQQAFFYTTHWGLRGEVGSTLELEMRSVRGRRQKVEIRFDRAKQVPSGPAFFPEAKGEWGREGNGDVNWCVMKEGGWGYVHVRRCKGNLPEMMDSALKGIGEVPGIIMDWRGNSGGGFDHDALFGRFVPEGKQTRWGKTYSSAGEAPYGGPVVVIVDATVRSAGETGSGMFKEDGRAYLIGESGTAGMSSSKKTIELPSGLFALYVSVYSNKARFNDGKGIEGIGVLPHEFVGFDPEDLAEEEDTLILRAGELLKRGFPRGTVPYEPRDFGWKR